MLTPFLLTGVTGGLGSKILQDLLHTHSLPPTSIIATSRSETNRARFESQGLVFRVADYNDPSTLTSAFQDVENLLFMSSSERDNVKRNREHHNVITAAKKAGVGKVWYVSLAFGGFGDGSKIGFQQAHYETETQLLNSGLDFISLRAGVYADAFPLFLNWYPSSTAVLLPKITPAVSESRIASASREELGEAVANLFAKGLEAFPSVQPETRKNIVLLTGPKAEGLVDLVGAINAGRRTHVSPGKGVSPGKDVSKAGVVSIEYLEPEDWISACAKDDVGGKGRAWFEARLVFTQGVCDGDAALVDPALETLLGRRPETGMEAVERLVREDPGYTWHQNHAR